MLSLFSVIKFLAIQPISRAIGRLVVEGSENLPSDGGYVVTCNHMGWVDPLWLGLAVNSERIYFLAKEELFRHKILGALLRKCHVVPIDRQRAKAESIRTAVGLLKDNKIVLIFPGGTRSSNMSSVKRGSATMALMAGVPIVPAIYEGPTKISICDVIRRPKITIRFLPRISRGDAAAESNRRQDIESITEALEAVYSVSR